MIDSHANTPGYTKDSAGRPMSPRESTAFLDYVDVAGIDFSVMLNYYLLLDGSPDSND